MAACGSLLGVGGRLVVRGGSLLYWAVLGVTVRPGMWENLWAGILFWYITYDLSLPLRRTTPLPPLMTNRELRARTAGWAASLRPPAPTADRAHRGSCVPHGACWWR